MRVISTTTVEICNARFQEIFGESNIMANGKIIVSHFGELSQDLIDLLSTDVETSMIECGDKKSTSKKMFTILIEGLQNMHIHGERDEEGNQICFLIVVQNAFSYKVSFGNLITCGNTENVISKIETLNKMNPEEVKQFYLSVLDNGIMSKKGGGGLGLITLALKSGNEIGYMKEQVSDDLVFFSVDIELSR